VLAANMLFVYTHLVVQSVKHVESLTDEDEPHARVDVGNTAFTVTNGLLSRAGHDEEDPEDETRSEFVEYLDV
jgi:hypothetical protein